MKNLFNSLIPLISAIMVLLFGLFLCREGVTFLKIYSEISLGKYGVEEGTYLFAQNTLWGLTDIWGFIKICLVLALIYSLYWLFTKVSKALSNQKWTTRSKGVKWFKGARGFTLGLGLFFLISWCLCTGIPYSMVILFGLFT